MLQLWLTEPTERKSLIKLRTELSEIRKNDQVLELQPQQTPSKRQLSVDECTASPTVLSFARRIESSVCLYAGSDELPASITSSPFLRSPSKTPISLPLKDPSPGADTVSFRGLLSATSTSVYLSHSCFRQSNRNCAILKHSSI
eukprot:m.833043 g.833043  ORF g.833043 m.833043 type:complete len:144 (+) comp59465_c0_seq32:1513-1944(+)